jgi:guanylate kinase
MSVLLVVAGPSGVGKGTVLEVFRERHPEIWFSVSAATRAPRPGETHGVDYFFIDHAEFERIRAEDGFLEWFDVYGDLKGTPKAAVDAHLAAGQDVLLEIDVQGALAIKAARSDAVLVFIGSPSREEQRRRIEERGADDPEAIARRLAAAADEEAAIDQFDEVIVNETVSKAADDLAAILARHRAARSS